MKGGEILSEEAIQVLVHHLRWHYWGVFMDSLMKSGISEERAWELTKDYLCNAQDFPPASMLGAEMDRFGDPDGR